MGDRVAVLKDGVLQQVDTPAWLLAKPANVFVAGFIGSEKAEGEVVIGGRPEGMLPSPRATGWP